MYAFKHFLSLKFFCLSALLNHAVFSLFRPISDVSSDLTVEVGASSLALHKVHISNTFELPNMNLFAHFR